VGRPKPQRRSAAAIWPRPAEGLGSRSYFDGRTGDVNGNVDDAIVASGPGARVTTANIVSGDHPDATGSLFLPASPPQLQLATVVVEWLNATSW
jgi:hypothetical protein